MIHVNFLYFVKTIEMAVFGAADCVCIIQFYNGLCQHNIFKNRIQRREVFAFSVYELLCVLPTADCKSFMESPILAPDS